MGVILGIDVGGSTTKIVGYTEKKELIAALQVRATDQLTSCMALSGIFIQHRFPCPMCGQLF